MELLENWIINQLGKKCYYMDILAYIIMHKACKLMDNIIGYRLSALWEYFSKRAEYISVNSTQTYSGY